MKFYLRIATASVLLWMACSSLSLRQTPSHNRPVWPQWGGSAHHDRYVPISLSWPLTLKWTVRTTAAVAPSLIALDDLVLFTTMDGKQETCRLADGKSVGNIRIRGSIPFTCAYSQDKLVILKRLGLENLLCYDLLSGHLKWRKTVGPCFGEPLLIDRSIYVSANNGRLSRHDLETGKELQSAALKNQTRATPSFLHDRIVIAGDRGQIEAFTADLQPVWTFNGNGSMRATATLSDHSCFMATTKGFVYALDVQTGALLWQKQIPGSVYQSAASDDSLVVIGCADHTVYGLSAADGSERWRFKTAAPIATDPLICGNSIVFGSMDKTLYALDKQTGEQIWSYTANARWRTNPIISGDRLLCAAEDDQLYCFGAP